MTCGVGLAANQQHLDATAILDVVLDLNRLPERQAGRTERSGWIGNLKR
jgi:hypothetical protein